MNSYLTAEAASTAPSAQFSKYFVTTKWVKATDGAVIIDTRDSTAYAAGHIKALSMSHGNYIFSRVEGTDGTQISYMISDARRIHQWSTAGYQNSSTTV